MIVTIAAIIAIITPMITKYGIEPINQIAKSVDEEIMLSMLSANLLRIDWEKDGFTMDSL